MRWTGWGVLFVAIVKRIWPLSPLDNHISSIRKVVPSSQECSPALSASFPELRCPILILLETCLVNAGPDRG